MVEIQIGNHKIGSGFPCFLVAEIGINHNGDIELAKKTIDAAAEAGADAVKFQSYLTEDFISDDSLTYEYISGGTTVIESQYEMFKRYELSKESLRELKEYSDSRGLIFQSTPTSKAGIRDLLEIGVHVLKNGSDYLTNLPLIRAMGQAGLPTVISTGMAILEEINDAVRAFRETGNNELILLHCISSYPTKSEDVHLRKIPALASAFGCLVGFSDHTTGNTASVGAVALGACWVEKHFTLDKSLPGPDHYFSTSPSEFRDLTDAVRAMEKSLGDSRIGLTPGEVKSRDEFRLSCVAALDLTSGHCLTELNIVFRRPGNGIPPGHISNIVGRCLVCDVKSGEIFKMEHFQ